MEQDESIAQHFTELGETALLSVLDGTLAFDQAMEGLKRRRIELLGPIGPMDE